MSFKFNLVDPEGNKLIDQSFFISVLGRLSSARHRGNDRSSAPASGMFTDVPLLCLHLLSTDCWSHHMYKQAQDIHLVEGFRFEKAHFVDL